jgi:hypothetical protein
MPELTEEFAAEAEAAFNDYEEGQEPEQTEETELEEPDKEESEKAEQEETDKKEGDAEKEEKAKSPQEILEEKYKEDTGESQEEEKSSQEEPPEKDATPKEEKSTQEGRQRVTKEDLANLVDLVSEDDFPEGEFVFGDNQIDMRRFAKEEPEVFQAAKVLAGTGTYKILNAAIKKGALVTGGTVTKIVDDFKKEITALNERIVDLTYWGGIAETHADAKKVAKTKEFKEAMESAPPVIKKAAKSGDVEDAVLVLDWFKEQQGKTQLKEFDENAKGKKEETDSVLKHNMRTERKKQTGKMSPEDEAEAAFNNAEKLFKK